MHKPLVTIGIPCFNAKDTVKDAIEAALKQDYPNIEVLVVDDCSTDGTKSYLQDLKKEFNFNAGMGQGVANGMNVPIQTKDNINSLSKAVKSKPSTKELHP